MGEERAVEGETGRVGGQGILTRGRTGQDERRRKRLKGEIQYAVGWEMTEGRGGEVGRPVGRGTLKVGVM